MKLSNQAVGALLMTLQKCLAEEEDISDLLRDWDLEIREEEIYVSNPPVLRGGKDDPSSMEYRK
jgi:hypothetical protein